MNFPGFNGTPTKERFPIYGIARDEASQLRMLVEVREKVGGPDAPAKVIEPRVWLQTFRNESAGLKACGTLNQSVAAARRDALRELPD